MSSYCTVCRGLFDEPHYHHCPNVPDMYRSRSPRHAAARAIPQRTRRPHSLSPRRALRQSPLLRATERHARSARPGVSPSPLNSVVLAQTPSSASRPRSGAQGKKGKAHMRVERMSDSLQETLDRICDAVRRDNAAAVDIKPPGKEDGARRRNKVDNKGDNREAHDVKRAAHRHDRQTTGNHSQNHTNNSGECCKVPYMDDHGVPVHCCAEDSAFPSHWGRHTSPSVGDTPVVPLDPSLCVPSVPRRSTPLQAQRSLSSTDSRESPAAIPHSCDEALMRSHTGGRQNIICSGSSTRCESLVHIESLREGFVELCAAVREDLHALNARVSRLRRCKRRALSQSQVHSPPSPSHTPSFSPEPVMREEQRLFSSSSHVREEMQAELRQCARTAVQEALQQYPPRGERWTSPIDTQIADISPEAFEERVRSVVRSFLRGDKGIGDGMAAELQHIRESAENAAAHAEQECERRTRQAFRRQCAALEDQIDALSTAVRDIRADVDELRAQPSIPLPSPTPIETTVPSSGAAIGPGTAEGTEEKFMRRLDARFAEAEEQCIRRVRAELLQPMLEHVRRLMSAHQTMIDSVVESRCAQFEKDVSRGMQSWDTQVADLRSRVASLRADVHRALRDLSGNLNVACPGF